MHLGNLDGSSPDSSTELSIDLSPPSSIDSTQVVPTPVEALLPLPMDITPQETLNEECRNVAPPESPGIAFDGIEFAAPNYPLFTTQNLPSLVNEEPHAEVPPMLPLDLDAVLPITETWCATDYMKMTLHGGKTLCVSPLDAFAADDFTSTDMTPPLASPVELSISPSCRKPPPMAMANEDLLYEQSASPAARSAYSPLSITAESGWLEDVASPATLLSTLLWE